MKECFKCHQTLPLSEFYRHPMMGDGHLGKCKACARKDVQENRRAKIDYYRDYDVRRFHEDPDRRAAQYATSREMDRLYPERKRAHSLVSNAIRSGKLVREPCEVCGSTEKIEGHHDDYSRPLDVRWLCRRHHNEFHHPQQKAS